MADEPTTAAFAATVAECRRWQATAREFALAANYLLDWYDPPRDPGTPDDLSWSHSGGNYPAMVLYAVAVENLLKALRVAREVTPAPVSRGQLSHEFASHNLVHHAQIAGVRLSHDETALLDHLRDLIEIGRYPVARAPGKGVRGRQFDYPQDVERVWSMLERLESLLRETGKPSLPPRDLRQRYRPPGYDTNSQGRAGGPTRA